MRSSASRCPRTFGPSASGTKTSAPTSDEEVASLLADLGHSEIERGDPERSPGARAAAVPFADAPLVQEVSITVGPSIALSGDLTVPADANGVVVFVHGSGSSRLSPRNRAVAGELIAAGYATLLFDLLTPGEELDRANVFDIPLLAARLVSATIWLEQQHVLAALPLAYFGASTGAAAALTAAAELGDRVHAVISRGGRPDLAHDLAAVTAPTLLIVGGDDYQVLELNRIAQRQLRCESELAVVPGATHLFEEPGTLESVSRLAIDWLMAHLAQRRSARAGSGGERRP